MIQRQHQNEALRRATLYVRGSQLKPLGGILALQTQVDRCTAYSLEHGCIVPHDQHYSEVRAGSADSDCPELARLGEAVRQGCVAVVVSSLDGLARSEALSHE